MEVDPATFPAGATQLEDRGCNPGRPGSAMSLDAPMPMKRPGDEADDWKLDCYPYTFSPLLLFAQSSYFDKGYSNYNSVARFFAPAFDVDMLQGVLYERKNMLYEDLLDYVTKNRVLVTCCIDAHFTAFQVLSDSSLVYYDPLQTSLSLISGESFDKFVGFHLLKCCYGDSQHMQEHASHYTGQKTNPRRRMLYDLWRKINKLSMGNLYVRFRAIPLELDQYLLLNARGNPRSMSTQLTGNTCYFQTYLFAVLCKVGALKLGRGHAVELSNIEKLAEVTVALSRFLLEFFVEEGGRDGSTATTVSNVPSGGGDGGGNVKTMRPLTNSNFVLDFFRYREAPYHALLTGYLRHLRLPVPDYEDQYRRVLSYFKNTKTLHTYSRFTLTGAMPSTPNTKSLQPVFSTDDGAFKLARSNYYKYRACSIMFGFNTGIMHRLACFSEFNALRKNQLLACYTELKRVLGGAAGGSLGSPGTNKYRDYYFLPQFEAGQRELVNVHHYTYLVDVCAMAGHAAELVGDVNAALTRRVLFSTQKRANYEKILPAEEFARARKWHSFFLDSFMSVQWLSEFAGLGFAEVNPKEKEINSLTQTVFYSTGLMRGQAFRMEHEFEKECINQMARSTLRPYERRFDGGKLTMGASYRASIKIGLGYTYSKYNTLMHLINVVGCYWHNPDLNHIQVVGKDIRAILVLCTQKLFFDGGGGGGPTTTTGRLR